MTESNSEHNADRGAGGDAQSRAAEMEPPQQDEPATELATTSEPEEKTDQPIAATAPPQDAGLSPPAGWHADPQGVAMYRYWDGAQWTEHTSNGGQAAVGATAAVGAGGASTTPKPDQERKALLANALQGQVVTGGRIESQSDFQAVVVRGQKVNHVLHFLVGLFTLGLWWIVWLILAVTGGEKRQMVTVDEFGNVLVQRV